MEVAGAKKMSLYGLERTLENSVNKIKKSKSSDSQLQISQAILLHATKNSYECIRVLYLSCSNAGDLGLDPTGFDRVENEKHKISKATRKFRT